MMLSVQAFHVMCSGDILFFNKKKAIEEFVATLVMMYACPSVQFPRPNLQFTSLVLILRSVSWLQ
jgi:hypothetical protein